MAHLLRTSSFVHVEMLIGVWLEQKTPAASSMMWNQRDDVVCNMLVVYTQ